MFKITKNLPRNADLQNTQVTSKPPQFFKDKYEAAKWLAEICVLSVAQIYRNPAAAYRLAAKKLHPDTMPEKNPGLEDWNDPEHRTAFLMLQNAKELLEK